MAKYYCGGAAPEGLATTTNKLYYDDYYGASSYDCNYDYYDYY